MHLASPHKKKEASITATLYVYILMAVMDALIEFKTLEAHHPMRQPRGWMDQTLEFSLKLAFLSFQIKGVQGRVAAWAWKMGDERRSN